MNKHFHLFSSESFPMQSGLNIAPMLLAAVLVCVSASLYESILTWVLLMVMCGAAIRSAVYSDLRKHLPSVRTLNLMAVLSILGLIYSGLSLGFLLGMVNLLVLACALKLMQMRARKDIYQLVISLLFLIGCGFIFNQSIGYSIFYVLMIFILLLALTFYHAPSVRLKSQLQTIATTSLQASPIAILLFLVLPQLPPLWQTPTSKSAETGLAEQISPGDIAALSQSSDLSFRATFTGKVPPYPERYWRGIVMEEFDGKTWKIHSQRKQSREMFKLAKQEFSPLLFGPSIKYDIIAEPTHQNWLYGLDIAKPGNPQSGSEIWQSHNFQLVSHQKLVGQYQYSVESYPEAFSKQSVTHLDKQLNLQLPENGNPQTKKWVNELRKKYPNNRHFIRAIQDYFVNQSFVYTLRPEAMFSDPVDKFLFHKQAGFCSHYASALAYSLRLGNIPARVVTGYQGGELTENPEQASYLSVYQYDAHAWVEAWDEGIGWLRLDPTALVSPDRINLGLRQAMMEEGSFLADSPFSLARLTGVPLLNSIRLFLSDLDYNWSRWVLGFNSQRQKELFKTILGELTPDRMSLLGLAVTAIIGLLLGLFFLPHWLQNRLEKSQKYYFKALKLLEVTGTVREKWQGPQDFSQQIKHNYNPEISTPFDAITKIYMRLNYQSPHVSLSLTSSAKQNHSMMRKNLRILKKEVKNLAKTNLTRT